MWNFYYRLNNNIIISQSELAYDVLETTTEPEASLSYTRILIVREGDLMENRILYKLTKNNLSCSESMNLLCETPCDLFSLGFPNWVLDALSKGLVYSLNISNPLWQSYLDIIKETSTDKKKTLSLAGLGDVGGTLLLGLRLLGGDIIERVKIFDLDENRIERWIFECSQITSPSFKEMDIEIQKSTFDDLFNSDMFIFCVSVGVPKIGDEKEDVRMVQYRGNSKVISLYAREARKRKFKGTFAVVSDPVDHLCKAVLHYSNTDENGVYDGLGLAPDQISGFGLGVMNARAAFYSQREPHLDGYIDNGRAYGPHGEGLFIANNILDYNHKTSLELTHLTKTANLEVRKTGFKPFIAPALSSGTMSLLAYIQGDWHYSTNYIDGAFFGCRNRVKNGLIQFEGIHMPDELFCELKKTHETLKFFNPIM